jgi:uncharacterized membrane protein YeaQ/YmgE (transglycosylase-associated protein family)
MGIFHILWSLIVGFFAGLCARAVMGSSHMGLLMTTLLGIVGSVIGGFIASLIWKPRDARFHPAGFVFSILGAIIVLWISHKLGYY